MLLSSLGGSTVWMLHPSDLPLHRNTIHIFIFLLLPQISIFVYMSACFGCVYQCCNNPSRAHRGAWRLRCKTELLHISPGTLSGTAWSPRGGQCSNFTLKTSAPKNKKKVGSPADLSIRSHLIVRTCSRLTSRAIVCTSHREEDCLICASSNRHRKRFDSFALKTCSILLGPLNKSICTPRGRWGISLQRESRKTPHCADLLATGSMLRSAQ